MHRGKIIRFFGGVIFVFLLAFNNTVFAKTGPDWATVRSKAVLEGVYNCIQDGIFSKEWELSFGYDGMMLSKGDEQAIKLPYGKSDAKDNDTNCREIMEGFRGSGNNNISRGLLGKYFFGNDDGPYSDRKDKTNLEIAQALAGEKLDGAGGLGYKAKGKGASTNGGKVFQLRVFTGESFEMNNSEAGLFLSNGERLENGYVEFPRVIKDGDDYVFVEGTGDIITPSKLLETTGEITLGYSVGDIPGNNRTDYENFKISSSNGKSYKILYGPNDNNRQLIISAEDIYKNQVDAFVNDEKVDDAEGDEKLYIKFEGSVIDAENDGGYDDYRITNTFNKDKTMQFLQALNNNNEAGIKLDKLDSYDELALSLQEAYSLYKHYAGKSVLNIPIYCEGEDNYEKYKDDKDAQEVFWEDNKKCIAVIKNSSRYNKNWDGKAIYGIDSAESRHFNSSLIGEYNTIAQKVIDMLNDLHKLDKDDDDSDDDNSNNDSSNDGSDGSDGDNTTHIDTNYTLDSGGGTESNDEEEEKKKYEDCINAKGAEDLGWLVCPIMLFAADASSEFYDTQIVPNLMIESVLFRDGKSGARIAWEKFRDIANMAFVLIFLVVILSQITGFGLNNYSIKKILPKIIVAAILINLSYLICLLLVDVSNIVGAGVEDIFRNFSNNLGNITLNALPDSEFVINGESTTTFPVKGALAGLGVLGAVGVMFGLIFSNPIILVSLLVSALSAIVALFFFFLLLGARKGAVVIFVIISPLAVLAFLLPNTKRLYQKWWKAFSGLLLVYPIAGLLMGAGDYVSRLLLVTGDGFMMWISAIVVSVAPIFLIPLVLKSSFTAFGAVGRAMSGIGGKAGAKTGNAMRNSAGYKELAKMSNERKIRLKAGMNKDGTAKKLSRFGILRRGGRRNVARARSEYDSILKERSMDDKWMNSQFMDNLDKYREASEENEQEKIYGDVLDRDEKDGVASDFANSLRGRDAARAAAGFGSLMGRAGGAADVFNALRAADWYNMDSDVRSRLVQKMGASDSRIMNTYANYVSSGGAASFNDWINGTGAAITSEANNANIQDKSYGQYLLNGGAEAATGFSKEEMELTASASKAIMESMEQSGVKAEAAKNAYGEMMKNTAIYGKDARAKAVANGAIQNGLSSGNLKVEHLGVSSYDISNMHGSTATAMSNGVGGSGNLQSALQSQINGVRSDSASMTRLQKDTGSILGLIK